MGLFDSLKFLYDPRETFKQFESGFGRLFPGAPESEELTPDLDRLRELFAQLGDSDFIRNQVAEIFAKIPDTSTDFLQRVSALRGSSLQASEQAQAATTQRNQSAIELSNRLIQEGRQTQAQGLFGIAGLEQQGLFGAAGFNQDRIDAIQSFINSILSGASGAAGTAIGGGVSGRTQTATNTPGFTSATGFGNNNRFVTPNEQLGGSFGGTQSIGQLPNLFG